MEQGQRAIALNQALSSDELANFRRQIAKCWSPPVGARNAETLIVEIRLFLNPDATVQRAELLGGANRDNFSRVASESAMRAVLNPRCSPLALPPEKYEQWKITRLRFDPGEMLGYVQ